jgi:hypothetical protein
VLGPREAQLVKVLGPREAQLVKVLELQEAQLVKVLQVSRAGVVGWVEQMKGTAVTEGLLPQRVWSSGFEIRVVVRQVQAPSLQQVPEQLTLS